VDTVGPDSDGELDVVVHDQGHASGAAQLEERVCLCATQLATCRLVPVLDGDRASANRRVDEPHERVRVGEIRRQRVEAAREPGGGWVRDHEWT
jgi:hypothetical protein